MWVGKVAVWPTTYCTVDHCGSCHELLHHAWLRTCLKVREGVNLCCISWSLHFSDPHVVAAGLVYTTLMRQSFNICMLIWALLDIA
jgi:hypothetical protein